MNSSVKSSAGKTDLAMRGRKTTLQLGIRQRSLRRHCRLGRATELVFILATGVTLALSGGQAEAQTWNGNGTDDFWATGANWSTNTAPVSGGTAIIDGTGGADQPIVNAPASASQTNVSGGTLTVDSILTSPVTVFHVGNLVINATGEIIGVTVFGSTGSGSNAGTITGTLAVGDGTFANAGVVTGATTVSGGVLNLNTGTDLSDTEALTISGGVVNVNAAETVASVGISGGTLSVDSVLTAATVAISGDGGVIIGIGDQIVGNVTIADTGTLNNNNVLNGTLTIDAGTATIQNGASVSGATTVNDGQLTIANGGSLGTGQTLTVNGGNVSVGTGLNVGTLNGTGGTIGIDPVHSLTIGAGDYAGEISNGGQVFKTGAGTLTLSGTNTYTGVTTVSDGILDVTGSIGSSVIAVNGTATLRVDGESLLDTAQVALSATGTLALDGSETIGRLTSGAATSSVTLGAHTLTLASGNGFYDGGISGTGGVTVTGGTHQFNNSTAFTGAISVTGGSLGVNNVASTSASVSGGQLAGALSASTALSISDTGTYRNGNGQTIASVTQTGGTLSGDRTLTITGDYALSGGSVTIADASNPTVEAGTFTMSGGSIAADTTVNSAGAKTLSGGTIAGTLGGAGATTVQTGTVTVSTGSILGDVTLASGTLSLGNDTAVTGTITTTGSVIDYVDGVTSAALIDLDSNTTQLQVLTGSATQAGEISETTGPHGFEKIGDGTLILTGANTYTGVTSITAGTLRIENLAALGAASGGVTITGGATLALAGGITVPLGESVNLNGDGVGTGGALRSVSGNNVWSGAVTLGSASRIATDAGTLTVSGAVTNGGNLLTVSGAGATTISGNISGTGGLTAATTGGLTLSGTNTHEGLTTLNGGILNLQGGNAIGDNRSLFVAAGTLNFLDNEELGQISSNGGTINLNDNTITVNDTSTSNMIAALNGGAGAEFNKNGAGTMNMSGLVSMSDGTITVNNGTLVLSNGSNAIGEIVVDDATLSIAATGAAGGATGSIRTTGSIIDYADTVDNATPITIESNTTRVQVLAGTATQSGIISEDMAPRPLEKIGDGTLILSVANTYTGTTTVTAGTLNVTGSIASTAVVVQTDGTLGVDGESLLNTASVTLNGAGAMNLTGSEIIGSLTGASDSSVDLAAHTLTVGDATSTAMAGIISGIGGITKTGTGTLTLSGANDYTGATVVEVGTLTVSGSLESADLETMSGATLSVGENALTATADVTNAGTFEVTGDNSIGSVSGAGGISLIGAGTDLTLNAGASTITGVISGDGGLVVANTSATVLSGANDYTGGTTIMGGSLTVETGGTLGAVTGSTAISGGTLTVNTDVTQDTVTQSGGTINGTGTLTATSEFIHTGVTISSAIETPVFAMTDGTITAPSGSVTATTSAMLNDTNAINGTLSGGDTGAVTIVTGTTTLGPDGEIIDIASLDVDAGATLVTGGADQIDDTATITIDGTLTLGGAETLSGLNGAALGVVNNGGNTLTLGTALSTVVSSFAGDIRGEGNLVVGGGTQTLTGANTYTGATSLSGGNLTLSDSGSLVSTDVSIDDERVLTTQGGLATGTELVNDGSLVLTGSDEIGSLAGTGTVDVADHTLTTGGLDDDTAFSGVVSGAGSLLKTGTGTQTLSGDNTVANLTVQDGTLLLSGDNSEVDLITVGGGGVGEVGRLRLESDLAGGALIRTEGSVVSYGDGVNMATPIVLNSNDTQLEVLTGESAEQSGIISQFDATDRPIEKIGDGTLTLSADNAYEGATTVSGGVLDVTGSIASTDILVRNDASLVVDGESLEDTAAVVLEDTGNLTVNTAVETIGSLDAEAGTTITLNQGLIFGDDTTDTEIASIITGAGSLTKQGTSTVIVSGTSAAATGALTVNDGTIDLTGSIGSTVVNVNADGTLNVTEGGLAAGAAVTVTGGTLDVSTTDDTVTSVVLNGGEISGNATLNTNTFSQDTGTLSGTVSTTGTADLAGGSITGTLTGTGAATTSGTGTTSLTETGSISTQTLVIAADTTVDEAGTGQINTFGNLIDVDGGTLSTDGGDGIADDDVVRLTNGTLTLTGDETIAALNGSGTVNLTDADLTTSGNLSTVFTGIIQGTGALNTSGNNTLELTGVNLYSGATTVNGTAELVLTGSIDSTLVTVNNDGELILNNGDALLDTAAVVLNDTGTMTLANANSETIGSLAGAEDSSVNLGDNTLTVGENDTSTEMEGNIFGTGGLTKVGTGALTLSGTNALTGALNVNEGTIDLTTGSVASTVVNVDAEGTLDVAGGGLAGVGITLTNDGIVNANGATISGAIENNLTFNAQGATLTGSVNNTATGVFDFTGGGLTGPVTNAGDFILSGGAVSGMFTNTGTVTALGLSSVGGLSGPGTVSMLSQPIGDTPDFNTNTTDVLAINGPLSDTTFIMDVNLGAVDAMNPQGGTSDLVTVTGAVTGTLNFNFQNNMPVGAAPFLGGTILVLDGSVASDYDFTYSGLGTGGAVIYSLAKSGNDLEIVSETSAGIGGIAVNASLVQSLIGTVVNRPTSPFVSGLASEEGCSRGGYFRGTYGKSTVSGTSNNGVSSSESSVDASYYGVQGGYDFGCNDGRFFDGWDGSFGALVGYNKGSSDQDVVIGAGGGGTAVASVTHSDFEQKYVGAYAAFSKDRITADVQVRFEKSDFTLNETVNAGFFGLGLDNADFSTNSVNVTGRVSYRMDLNDDGLNFVPTGGLSYTRTSAATVNFTGGETLQIDAFDSIVGFVGGTIAKTTIAPAGNAGTTYFGSANYYHDFASDRSSVFSDGLGGTENITTDSIGGFGELSMGVNYVRILENGPAGAKQLNANVRVDTRFGSNVKNSSSITAQVRLSF